MPRAPAWRTQAPVARTASVVCLDGMLKPSGSVSHQSAGGRGRAIAWDSRCRTAVPVVTARYGMQAARHLVSRAVSSTMIVITKETNGGSASSLIVRAVATAHFGRECLCSAAMAMRSKRVSLTPADCVALRTAEASILPPRHRRRTGPIGHLASGSRNREREPPAGLCRHRHHRAPAEPSLAAHVTRSREAIAPSRRSSLWLRLRTARRGQLTLDTVEAGDEARRNRTYVLMAS